MKLLDFSILNGWPASSSTWKFMQEQLLQLQILSLLGGNNFIVSGCTDLGGTIDNGWVVVNGEILPFVGGAVQANVVIVDTAVNRGFSNGTSNPYYHNRVATFGVDGAAPLWTSFEVNDPSDGVLKRLRVAEALLATINTGLATKANSSDVLKKGGTTAFTPALATDPANKAYVDAAIGAKCVFAGQYNHTPNTVTALYNPLGITVSSTASGATFTLAHGLNTPNYFVTLEGIGDGSFLAITSLANNSFSVATSYGGSLGQPKDFYFQIFKY